MSVDTRASSASEELDALFADINPPPVSGLRRRHLRRRATRAAIAGIAAIAIAIGVTGAITSDRSHDRVRVERPTPVVYDLGVSAAGPVLTTLEVEAGRDDALRYDPSALDAPTGIVRIALTSLNGEHTMQIDNPSGQPLSPSLAPKAGQRETVRVFFAEPGEYVFYDPTPGHREAGMTGTITVTGAAKTREEAEAEAAADAHGAGALPSPRGPKPARIVAVSLDGRALVTVDSRTGNEIGEPVPVGSQFKNDAVISNVILSRDGRTTMYEVCCNLSGGTVLDADGTGRWFDGSWPALSPDGKKLALRSGDGLAINIWDIASGFNERSIDSNGEFVTELAWSPDGTRIAVSIEGAAGGRPSRTLKLLDASASDLSGAVVVRSNTNRLPITPVFLPDGRLLFAERRTAGDDAIQPNDLYVARSDGSTALVATASAGVADMAVSQAGHILVAGLDGRLRWYDDGTWHEIARGYIGAAW